ncbi:hypothetical protein N431DRAFT_343719 [Stipitochalara longipes BDJ]|nr:hypothetical protein N431DRAFT_343719 [Stipitochalara longipes BDJ]
MKGHWQSDGLSYMADNLDQEHWADYEAQTASFPAPFCGICVLRNLHPSSTGRLPNRQHLERFQKHNKSQHIAWSSCRSTRTLISKTSESLKGTGRWFLDHERYNLWLNQPSAFLWLCGRPGAGKSVLMSTVIRDLAKTRRSGELVVYYFANGYYHGVSTAKAILCSMLGQLLCRDPTQNSLRELLPLLNDLVAAGNPISSSSMIWLFSRIRHRLRGHETLYLLLDGLDEESHSPQERELLLELIDHASRHDPNHQIKCFVSSRSNFFGNRLPKGALRVDLDSNPLTRKDMSLYVQDSLHKSVFPSACRDVQELEEQLLNSASGSFLILRLILEQGRPGIGNSKATFKEFLVNLNDFSEIGLGKMYGGMLARIEDCNKEAALSMLRWVTFAARPLESKELLLLYKQSGIEIKEEDISNISAGLLISAGNQIRFTHFSVREYLESQLSDRWEELSEEANEMIAHACLKLLSTENILQSLSVPTKSVPTSKGAIASGFVPYAQTHWIFHYKRGERRSTYLAGLLHDILEQCFVIPKKSEHKMEANSKQNAWGSIESSPTTEGRQNNFESLNFVNIALGVSSRFGFVKLANLELDMGANINGASGAEQQTPLCLAARWGHLEVARLLLQRGADPLITSGSGLTPMAYAMANGHYELQDLLMKYPAEGPKRSACHTGLTDPQDATQELWLTALVTTSCNSCTASMVEYELRAVPEIWDKGEVLPPILVSGETISLSELQFPIKSSNIGTASGCATLVRWYPGAHMYRVLHSISKRGIDDVRRLLIAAGNDKDGMDMVISMSKLLARSSL